MNVCCGRLTVGPASMAGPVTWLETWPDAGPVDLAGAVAGGKPVSKTVGVRKGGAPALAVGHEAALAAMLGGVPGAGFVV